MAAPVSPNGVITLTIDIGRTLIVSAEAGSKGTAAVFNGSALDVVDHIGESESRTYGPYPTARTCRLYAEAGTLDFMFSSTLSALPSIAAPTIDADGKTISGTGVKPGTAVPVYNADTGVALGQPTSLADGSWSLTLRAPLAAGTRVGFDPVIVGPSAIVQAGGGGGGGGGGTPAQGGTLDFSNPANSGLQPAV